MIYILLQDGKPLAAWNAEPVPEEVLVRLPWGVPKEAAEKLLNRKAVKFDGNTYTFYSLTLLT